jgi:GT2 family glycosyltransferase
MRFDGRRPALSVVIASRAGPILFQALSSLSAAAAQVDGEVEVVLAFDGVAPRLPEPSPTDGPAIAIRSLSLVRSGLPAARNAGWKAASSGLVLFLDEDMIASPALLSAHLAAHAGHPGSVVVGRVIETPDPMTPWGEYEVAAVERRWRRLRRGRPGPIRVSMSNASVGRAALQSSGGFAGWLPSEDDIELGFRLQSSGLQVIFADQAASERRSSSSYEEWRTRARTRGRLDVAIYRDGVETGGTESLLASFRERHPLNRAVIRLAFRSPRAARLLLGAAAWIGIGAYRTGLKRFSRVAVSVVANVEYWAGIREGLRGRASLRSRQVASLESPATTPAARVGR